MTYSKSMDQAILKAVEELDVKELRDLILSGHSLKELTEDQHTFIDLAFVRYMRGDQDFAKIKEITTMLTYAGVPSNLNDTLIAELHGVKALDYDHENFGMALDKIDDIVSNILTEKADLFDAPIESKNFASGFNRLVGEIVNSSENSINTTRAFQSLISHLAINFLSREASLVKCFDNESSNQKIPFEIAYLIFIKRIGMEAPFVAMNLEKYVKSGCSEESIQNLIEKKAKTIIAIIKNKRAARS